MLFKMTSIDKNSNEEKIIYGHVTENVIDEFWKAHITKEQSIKIEQVSQEEVTKIMSIRFCSNKYREEHFLGEFPMTCYKCHIFADS